MCVLLNIFYNMFMLCQKMISALVQIKFLLHNMNFNVTVGELAHKLEQVYLPFYKVNVQYLHAERAKMGV